MHAGRQEIGFSERVGLESKTSGFGIDSTPEGGTGSLKICFFLRRTKNWRESGPRVVWKLSILIESRVVSGEQASIQKT